MKNILIIDDNEIDIFVQSRLLKKQSPDCKIASYPNGKLALEYLQKTVHNNPNKLPDIIFLDLNMPIMNGWDFIKIFTDFGFLNFKDIAVFITSCSVFKDEIKQINKIKEIKDYVLKPLTLNKIEDIMIQNFVYC